MMREYSEYAQSEGCHCEESTIDRSRPTRRRLSYAEITSHPKNTQFDFTEKVASEKKAHMVDIVEFDEPTSHKDNSASFLEQVMKYGQQIQEEYKLDHSEKTKESLMVPREIDHLFCLLNLQIGNILITSIPRSL